MIIDVHGHFTTAPKQLQRVQRLQRVMAAGPGLRALPWVALALEAGYSDQSHFNRDFRDFTGFTPGEFVARRVPGSDLGFARDD